MRDAGLSARERQILVLMAAGRNNVQIGRMLYIATNTVKTYTQRMYDRYGVHNRAGLVATAIREGWIE